MYDGDISGIYDDVTIQSMYHYQLLKGVITPQDDVGLR
jgi:hypothetical protein